MTRDIDTLDKIEKRRREEKVREFTRNINKEFEEFKKEVFPKRLRRKWKLIKFIGKFLLILLVVTSFLGLILLLKIIIQSLF